MVVYLERKKLYNPPSPAPEKHHHIMTERGDFTVSTLSLADKFRNYMKFISKWENIGHFTYDTIL